MEVDNLEIRVESEAKKAITNLDTLSEKLDKVGRSLGNVNSGGLDQFANGISKLSVALNAISGVKTTDFTRLAKNIEKLSIIDNKSINRASGAIRNIASSLNQISSMQAVSSNMANLASSIAKLGYKTSTNAIANIPKLASAMKELLTTLASAPRVSENVIKLTNALSNLASQGSKVKTATNGIASGLNNASNQANKFSRSARTASTSTVSLVGSLTKLIAVVYTVRRIFGTLWKSIGSAMDYSETINLFQTALKKVGMNAAKEAGYVMGTKAAEEYAINFMHSAEGFSERISNKLGLDPNMTKQYQATFAQITNAMGNTAKTADNVSRSFVMLGNDIASLWNIDTVSAMQKLQAGLAGQVKPLRELGIDITNASLQQTAYNYGIDQNISKMSQATKVQLRYLTIMRQSSVAFGDMAKTINSPANQLRVLKQQWDNLCRSIGNVFLPLLQTVIPAINGLVIALRRVIDSIAAALGYETPDYSDTKITTTLPEVSDLVGDDGAAEALDDIGKGYDNIGKSASDATKSIEKFKKVTMGFDQFNIVQNNLNNSKGSSGSGSSSSGSSSGGGYSKLDDAISNATNGYMQKFNEELAKMSDEANKIADNIQPKIEAIIEGLKKFAPVFAGIAAAFAAYKLVKLFEGLGSTLSVLGTPAGIIALVVGALVGLGTAIYNCWKKAKEADLAKRFGDITFSAEELKKIAKDIVDNGTLDKLKMALSSWEELDETRDKIEKAVETLNKLSAKISLGITLSGSDETEYKRAVEDYIKGCKDYAEQEHIAVAMSIDLLIEDENVKQTMLENSNKFYNAAEGELASLGKKLNDKVTSAWSDGLLEIDEAKEIQEIQTQMSNVMERLAKSEFKAKMQMIQMDYGGVNLTPDTFEKLIDETQKVIEESAKEYEKVTINLLASVNAKYEAGIIDTTEYEREIEAIKLGKLSNIGELTLNATKFNLTTLCTAFDKELSGQTPKMKKSVKDEVNKWFELVGKGGANEGQWGKLFAEIGDNIKGGFKELSGTAKSNLKDMLDNMKPTKAELEKEAEEYRSYGKAIPINISKGLTSIYELEAMTGNTEALYKLIGASLTGTEYEKMIKQAKDSGVVVPEEISRGIGLQMPDVESSTQDIIDTINTTITSQNDNLIKTSSSAGESVGQSYADGIEGKHVQVKKVSSNLVGESKSGIKDAMQLEKGESRLFKNYGKYAADSFISMINDRKGKANTAGSNLASGVKNGAINGLGIASGSSSVFSTYGKNTVDGFNKGISNNAESTKNTIGSWARSFINKFKGDLGIHSPSKVFGDFGSYSVEGYNNSIEDNIGSTKSVLGKWGDTIKTTAKGFSIAPLNMQSNYSVNTKGLEGYSDLISGNVNVGGNIETTTTQIIQGIGEDIYRAVKQAVSEIPPSDSVMYLDSEVVARSVNKRNSLQNERYQTVIL